MSLESHWFKPVYFEGRNLDECWFNGLRALVEYGRRYVKTDGSFAGNEFLEFDFASGVIYEPVQFSETGEMLPLAVTVPEGCPAPTTDEKIRDYFWNYLMNGRLAENEHYKYATWVTGGEYVIPAFSYYPPDGEPLVTRNLKVRVYDQLQWCINHFKKIVDGKPNLKNNHCCIQIGYPESNLAYDLEYSTETERGTSPCLRLIDLKLINEPEGSDQWHLCAYVYFRAWNFYAWPENLGGIAYLMYYAANQISDEGRVVRVGPLSFFSKGLNCYMSMLQAIKMRTGSSAFEGTKWTGNRSPL